MGYCPGRDQETIQKLVSEYGWTEEKELAYYQKNVPQVDEKDFDFDLCDNVAFQDYRKKMCIEMHPVYIERKQQAFADYFKKNPLVDVEFSTS